jgi:hypothetical protein
VGARRDSRPARGMGPALRGKPGRNSWISRAAEGPAGAAPTPGTRCEVFRAARVRKCCERVPRAKGPVRKCCERGWRRDHAFASAASASRGRKVPSASAANRQRVAGPWELRTRGAQNSLRPPAVPCPLRKPRTAPPRPDGRGTMRLLRTPPARRKPRASRPSAGIRGIRRQCVTPGESLAELAV